VNFDYAEFTGKCQWEGAQFLAAPGKPKCTMHGAKLLNQDFKDVTLDGLRLGAKEPIFLPEPGGDVGKITLPGATVSGTDFRYAVYSNQKLQAIVNPLAPQSAFQITALTKPQTVENIFRAIGLATSAGQDVTPLLVILKTTFSGMLYAKDNPPTLLSDSIKNSEMLSLVGAKEIP
jgi:uncharacterized protein YjbI with pentapeptide repeats